MAETWTLLGILRYTKRKKKGGGEGREQKFMKYEKFRDFERKFFLQR